MADGVGACRRCKAALVRWFVEPVLVADDTRHDVARKQALVTLLLGCLVTILLANVVGFVEGFPATIENIAHAVVSLYCAAAYLWLRWMRCASDALCGCIAAALCVGIMAADLQSATRYSNRTWSLFLIVLDFCLVCDLSSSITHAVVCSSAVWVVVMAVEASHRVGLYDLPGLEPMEKRLMITDCDTPPCAVNDVATSAIPCVAALLLDFVITRGFSHGLREKEAKLEESVDVAGRLAAHLATYDVDAAEELLEMSAGKLPSDMAAVFSGLVSNLRLYRPYLPDALFNQAVPDDLCTRGDSPSSPTSASTDDSSDSAISSVSEKPADPVSFRVIAANTTKLELKRVSILAVSLDLDPAGLVSAADYVADHTLSLSLMIEAVRMQRGSLSSFQGDCFYASFNAFSSAFGHQVKAVCAAADMVQHRGHRAAVTTGLAHAGYLGTDVRRSPTIVGSLSATVELLLRAGAAVAERALCCQEAAAGATNTSVPLQALLHRFRVPAGDDEMPQDLMLYALREDVRSESHRKVSTEWMYEIEGMTRYTVYNDMAVMFRERGVGAVRDHLHEIGEALLAEQFVADAGHAKVVDLCTRVEDMALGC
eukprot:TRINITY_DN2518_c3_g2_i1.p1 TRINITY_DN2518_c3_g2~~TRINITY_DN2518_c3_g2_i1.p1  ORF type:complete len:598 (+),score=131.66 TRINITY_DN2518_c3_g2_i1:69-1862(+)